MKFYILLFFMIFCSHSSYFKKVLEGAQFIVPEDEKIFIFPVDLADISRIDFDSRMLFNIKKSCSIVSISDGTVIEVDLKRKYIKIKSEEQNQKIIVKYFDIDKISVKNGEKVKKGQEIGTVLNSFSIQVRLNEVIVNLLDYVENSQKERAKHLIVKTEY